MSRLMQSANYLIACIAILGAAGLNVEAQNPALAPAATSTSPTATAAFGAISGTVVDSSKGAPIPWAVVTAELQPPSNVKGAAPKNNAPMSTRTARTGAAGDFTIPNLPPGSYEICIHAQQGQWLNPCLWNSKSPTATVTANQTTGNVNIAVDKGAVVKLRVNDPGGNLSNMNTAPGTEFVIGPRSTRGFLHRMPMVSRDANGVNYEGLVPTSAAVRLSVLGKSYSLSDSAGNAFGAAAGDLLVAVPAAVPEIAVTVTVTGRN